MSQASVDDPVIAKIKRIAMRIGGDNGIRGLHRAFQYMDDNGDHNLDKLEFSKGLKGYGIELSTSEVDRIFSVFDKSRDGRVSVTEFICALRGGLSAMRLAAVNRVFHKFRKTANGNVSVYDIRKLYDLTKHPKVLTGEISAEDIQHEVLGNFEEMGDENGEVSRQDFEMYYAAVSAGIESDDVFLAVLNNCWGLTPQLLTPQVKAVGQMTPAERTKILSRNNDRDKAAVVISKLRAQLMASSLGLRGIGRELRLCDKSGKGYVTKEDLNESLYRCRLDYTDGDVEVLSRVYIQPELGIDLLALMLSLEGTFPATRKVVLERTWLKFPRNDKDQVQILWLQGRFNPKMMPQVVMEEMKASKMMSNFLDVWDARKCPSGYITYEEFEESYVHISEMIDADDHFETMLHVTWNV